MEDETHALALAESVEHPETSAAATPIGQALLDARDPVFYRDKSAAVLWMLRDLIGEGDLKQALARYGRDNRLDADSEGFERLVEKVSGKSLRWFFDDWVYHDGGLPELSIVSVTPRELSRTNGEGTGSLVAVEFATTAAQRRTYLSPCARAR